MQSRGARLAQEFKHQRVERIRRLQVLQVANAGQLHPATAVDLRGHGYSDAPESGYDDSANWAGDVAAVLAAEGVTENAILLGWSYGGLVICDYLAAHGTGAVAGEVIGLSLGSGRQRLDRDHPLAQSLDARLVNVGTTDAVAHFRQAGAGHQPDVAGADHCDSGHR